MSGKHSGDGEIQVCWTPQQWLTLPNLSIQNGICRLLPNSMAVCVLDFFFFFSLEGTLVSWNQYLIHSSVAQNWLWRTAISKGMSC